MTNFFMSLDLFLYLRTAGVIVESFLILYPEIGFKALKLFY